MSSFVAHIGSEEQTVREHCLKTALLSSKYAATIKAEKIGMLQGILHDAGKLTAKFQEYIRGESKKRRGEIDHSYAGAKYVCELAGKNQDVALLIAHTILSHHGLHDWLDRDDEDYCTSRVQKTEDYQEVQVNIGELISEKDALSLLNHAAEEYKALENNIRKLCEKKKRTYAFYFGMFERFLESCLVDADRTNTADFMSGISSEKQYDIVSVWEAALKRMNEKCAEFSKCTDVISQQRCNISDRCAAFAKNKVGACRLIVPTGGGKTLSALRFALEYCIEHGTQKIVYTAPFMSILEQNSEEIRKIIGDENLVEHHSNFVAEIEGQEELQEYELRTEKWDSPVIATTMVQLLNTLFSGKSSAVRRMHRLSNAVIIIDEVQSLPLKCIYLFNLAVNFLTHICGSTVILCSATQPALEQIEYPILLDEVDSMTGDVKEDFEVFRRTKIIPEVTPYDSLSARAKGTIKTKDKDNADEYAKAACEEWIDVRSFGQVFAFKGEDVSVGVRGPVSVQIAESVSPVEVVSMQITKSVNSESKKGKSSDTMGTKHRVSFGMYVINGSINCQLAEKTGFTAEDAEKIKKALSTLFENDSSSARPEGSMEVCRLYWWEHDSKTPKCSSAEVFRSINIKLKDGVETPKSYKDYEIRLEKIDGVDPEIIELV